MDEIAKYVRATGTGARVNATAQIGDLERHTRSKENRCARPSAGPPEHEHILARINLVLPSIDPKKGMSAYDKKAYRESATVTIPATWRWKRLSTTSNFAMS